MLICVVWAVPIFYGLLSMTDWSCTVLCTCTLTYRNPAHHICQANDNSTRSTCSSIYTPMAKSYLFVVVVIWFLECFVLITLFLNSLYQTSKSERIHLNVSQSQKLQMSISSTQTETKMTNLSTRRKSSATRILVKYRNSHQILLILFLLFFACTSPIMTCFTIDYLSTTNIHFNSVLVNVLTPLPFLYCLLSPILLLRRLGGLRSAISMLLTITLDHRKSKVSPTKKRKKHVHDVKLYENNNKIQSLI